MLKKILKLKKNDILSIVGSGGKTTTMYKLGKELSNEKVLLTTSTKIRREYNTCLSTVDCVEEFKYKEVMNKNYLSGNTVENNKFTGITNDQLEEIKEKFDYIIIEADGSKTLHLKGWREKEPVILKASNKTLGIIPFDIINKRLAEIEIFNKELFFEMVGKESLYFDAECIKKIVKSEKGIFKNSINKKYILFNKCDTKYLKDEARKTIDVLKKDIKNIEFIYGSSNTGEYYVG